MLRFYSTPSAATNSSGLELPAIEAAADWADETPIWSLAILLRFEVSFPFF